MVEDWLYWDDAAFMQQIGSGGKRRSLGPARLRFRASIHSPSME